MKCEACEHDNVDGARFCANCGAIVPVPVQEAKGLVGQTIGGRFRIIRVLGEGGMGVVYEAEQPMGSTIRRVAVKTLHPHLSHDPSVSARFHRECGTVAQLEHPNTIKVYDFGATSDGTLYIAMEFVHGTSLMEEIRGKGTLPADRSLKILRQIAGSLAEAHQQGIIHRDLKPENVVLTARAGENDVVKLLDFGIAARTESADAQKEQKLTQQGMVLGTPPYMSPEQFTGKALDARSDIYSLGVMAYEMLTGRLPFTADTPWQWATEHMMSQPMPFEASPSSHAIPEQMRAAVMRSLAKDRAERQATVMDFIKELTGESVVPAVAAAAGTGTSRMEAVPDFGAGGPGLGSAKTAAMPANTGGGIAMAPAVPQAPPRGSSGGGKGLILGLGGAAAALLIGIIAVSMSSGRSGDEPPPPPEPAQKPAAVATVEPEPPPTPPADEPTPSPEPEGDEATPVRGTKTPKPGASGAPTASAAPTSTPAATEAPKPSETAAPKPTATTPPASSGDACKACQSGNVQAAVSAYQSCSDPAAKNRCLQKIKGQAVTQAGTAANNGNCAQAKAIAAAANSIGAGTPRLAAAIKACP